MLALLLVALLAALIVPAALADGTITATPAPAGRSTITDNGTACVGELVRAATGDTIVVTASPSAGYQFAGWSGGGSCETLAQGATCTFLAVLGETDNPTFTHITYTVHAAADRRQRHRDRRRRGLHGPGELHRRSG